VLIMLVIATAGAFVGFATFPRDSENEAAQISHGEERDSIFLFGKHWDYDYDYNYDYDYDYDYYGTCGKLGAVCSDLSVAPCCSEFKCLTRFNHPYFDDGVKRCDIPELPQARLPSPPPPPSPPSPPSPTPPCYMGEYGRRNLANDEGLPPCEYDDGTGFGDGTGFYTGGGGGGYSRRLAAG
jgi:hypothetical protein